MGCRVRSPASARDEERNPLLSEKSACGRMGDLENGYVRENGRRGCGATPRPFNEVIGNQIEFSSKYTFLF